MGGHYEAIKLAFERQIPVVFKTLVWPIDSMKAERDNMEHWLLVMSLCGLVLISDSVYSLKVHEWGVSAHYNSGVISEYTSDNIIEFSGAGDDEDVVYRHVHTFGFDFTNHDMALNKSCIDIECVDSRDLSGGEFVLNYCLKSQFKMGKRKVSYSEEKNIIQISEKYSDLYFMCEEAEQPEQFNKIVVVYHNDESQHTDIASYVYQIFDKYIEYDASNLVVWLYEKNEQIEEVISANFNLEEMDEPKEKKTFFRSVQRLVRSADENIFKEDMKTYSEWVETCYQIEEQQILSNNGED